MGRFAGARLLDGTTPATQLGTSIFIGNFTESDGDNIFNQIVIGDSAEGGGQNTVTLGNNSIVSTRLKGSVSASIFSGSFVGDGSGLTGIPGVTPIATGSFATTGSNSFIGSQRITGSLSMSNGQFNIITGSGALTSSLSFTHTTIDPITGNATLELRYRNNDVGVGPENNAWKFVATDNGVQVRYDQLSTSNKMLFSVSSFGSNFDKLLIWRDVRLFEKSLTVDENLIVTGSANIIGGVTGSSFTGSFRGDGSGLTGIPGATPIATGSFATTGSNIFVGNQTISGSLTVSGSLLQGAQSLASGVFSHAEGRFTTASGNYSHAEGIATLANGLYAHAEGSSTTASGAYSHAEGYGSLAINSLSAHAEGYYTTASADFAHAEGYFSTAKGVGSHAEGAYTIASGSWQHAQGIYNIALPNPSAFIIGNGTAEGARSNLVFASGSQFQITGSLIVTGSANIIGGVTGSSFTGSFVGDGSGLTGIPGVTPIATGSFATTGSNRFVGNQTITGSLRISGSFYQIGDTDGNIIIESGSISLGSSRVLGANSIAAGKAFISENAPFSIAVGFQLRTIFDSTALFGAYNTSSNAGQTIIGIASNTTGIGEGAFIIGNGTDASTRSNLLVAHGNNVQITGSLLVTGSANINGFTTYPQVSASLNFANDAAAASGGVPLGGIYRSGSFVLIRLV